MATAFCVSCDGAVAHSVECVSVPGRPHLVLATTILASSLAFVDGSVVNVALPAIGRDLAAGAEALQWIVNIYLLPLSALLLLGGAAGDRYGRRRLLILGTALFLIASMACALAPGLPFLIAARFLQGGAAAVLMPNSLAILGATFSGEEKGRAVGMWAAAGAAMGAVGPVLGGWLVDLGSWRAIFLINLPLAAGAIVLALRYVPPDRVETGPPLDWAGGALATLALATLASALTMGASPAGWTIGTIAAGCGSLVLFAAFLMREHRLGDAAMTPLSLFGSGRFVGLSLLTLLIYGAGGALFVLLPFLLIELARYSATAAGAALLPLPLIMAVLSPRMGRLAARSGSRLPLALGSLVVAIGFAMALRIDARADYWTDVFPAVAVIAVGMSATAAPLTTAVLSSVDPRHTGAASGLNSALARAGGLVATALLGFVLQARGDALLTAFHVAMAVGATACVAASASALALVRDRKSGAGM
jgi:EmrB/QacA subfamily drug resistance transporter